MAYWIAEKIGAKIRHYRKEHGLTQAELSDRTQGVISSSVISQIETGNYNTPLFTLCELCMAMDLSLKDVVPEGKVKYVTKLKIEGEILCPLTGGVFDPEADFFAFLARKEMEFQGTIKQTV